MESFIFSKLFWGLIIVLIGVSFMAQAVFKINLPIGKIVAGLFFIYIGVKMLFGVFGKNQQATFMDRNDVQIETLKDSKYDIVFGSQSIDLSQASSLTESSTIEVNVVFGSAKVIIPKNAQVQIKSASVFGSVKTPGNNTVFGESDFSTGSGPATIYLKVNAVFGSAIIFEN